MVRSRADIWTELMNLVSSIDSVGLRQVGKTLEYRNDTDLVDDLGLVGDDAFEFMEAFASRFGVRSGDYKSSNYFDPEGLWLLPSLRKSKPTMHITLGMLVMAAGAGEWDTETLEQARQQQRYE